jgi:hypothetical protein
MYDYEQLELKAIAEDAISAAYDIMDLPTSVWQEFKALKIAMSAIRMLQITGTGYSVETARDICAKYENCEHVIAELRAKERKIKEWNKTHSDDDDEEDLSQFVGDYFCLTSAGY